MRIKIGAKGDERGGCSENLVKPLSERYCFNARRAGRLVQSLQTLFVLLGNTRQGQDWASNLSYVVLYFVFRVRRFLRKSARGSERCSRCESEERRRHS
jgi:hypothetical protein